MSFLRTVAADEADGEVAEMYQKLEASMGYLPNYGREFSHRPGVFAAWARLSAAVRGNMDPRRYELATVAAAAQRRSTYCTLAHAEKLLDLGSTPDQVVNLVNSPDHAGLDDLESAIVEYAARVARDPVSVTQGDIDRLRELGLTDTEIFDLAAAAAARLFFTALADATGTLADDIFRSDMPEIADALSVGRPMAG